MGVFSFPKFQRNDLMYLFQSLGIQPANSSAGFLVPLNFLSIEIEIVDFIKIVIFRSHPINGHEIIFKVLFLKLLGKLDGRDNFVEKVERPGKQVQLMARNHRKALFLTQFLYILKAQV